MTNKVEKRFIIYSISFLIFSIIILVSTSLIVQSKYGNHFSGFYAEINNKVVLTKNDIVTVPLILNENSRITSPCFKDSDSLWICEYGIKVEISEEASSKIASEIDDSGKTKMLYYFNDRYSTYAYIDSNLKNEPFSTIIILGKSTGVTEEIAAQDSVEDMKRLHYYLKFE